MGIKSETSKTTATRKVAILTKDWTYYNLQSEKDTIVPAGTEYVFGEYSNMEILQNGSLRWFYWDIPKGHFRIVTDVITTTTTIEVKRMD